MASRHWLVLCVGLVSCGGGDVQACDALAMARAQERFDQICPDVSWDECPVKDDIKALLMEELEQCGK